jgi:hypothetical protein
VNFELKRIWKKVFMSYFKVLSQHLSGGTKESSKISSKDSHSVGQDLCLGPPKYGAVVLATLLQISVHYEVKELKFVYLHVP